MATYTITTSVNIDTLASKAGSDTYNINGGYLTVDQDTRYGTNQNTSAAMGNIAMSAALGGTIEFKSTKVRLIPYNSGTGTVPPFDTTVSKGSASGKLIGVYSALNVAPTATGSAMPASGYLKIRQWNDIAYSSGVLTGTNLTGTCTGADVEGWLEIVGVDALTTTVNRLNTFKVTGDYFKFLGVMTDGTRATTYQLPTNGSLTYIAGVEVQSAPITILSASWTSGTATYVVASHNFNIGHELTISGSSPSQYDVTDSIITYVTSGTFSTSITSDPGNWTSGGTATVYDAYPNAGSKSALLANIATDEIRGKWCWIGTDGLVRFGHDGTNSTGGYIPPAGRKIRVPNIFFQTCLAAALTVNALPNATLATRMEFLTTGGGVLNIDKCCMNWYLNLNQPFSVALTNVYTFEAMVLTECASPISWRKVVVGQTSVLNTQTPLTFNLNFAGGTMANCVWTRIAQAGATTYINSWSDCSGFILYGDRNHSLTKAGNAAAGSYTLTRVTDTNWYSSTLGGGRNLLVGCSDLLFNSQVYYDPPAGTTTQSIPMFAYDLTTAPSSDIVIDNLNFGILSQSLVQPYSGFLQLGIAGCSNIYMRNLGTADCPLDAGGAYTPFSWSRVTTTMTITSTAHNIKAQDLIAVNVISDAAPKAVTTTAATLWIVAAAPTANTLSVTVANSGQTTAQSGSYYVCMAGTLATFVAGAAANNIIFQRCYVPHLRTGLLSGIDNSNKNITMESVWGTEWGVQLMPQLNGYTKNIQSTPSLAAQTSCYGTHWIDFFTTAAPVNTGSVSWTRTTTVAGVTSSFHGLRAGDQIVVSNTSDKRAIINGVKTLIQNTAVANPQNPNNVFSFTCLNGGDTTGTLSFVPLNGRVAIQMNEPTTETSGTSIFTSGSPAYTSAGSLAMPLLNDQVVFETPDFIKGHKNFPIAEVVLGTGLLNSSSISYAIMTGTSYSDYKNLYYSKSGGGGVNGTFTASVTNTTGIAVNDYVWGTNISPLAKVDQIINSTDFGVTVANTGTVSGILRFNHLPSEPDIPSTGFKMKIKINTDIPTSTPPTSLYFFTFSTSSTRSQVYPLDFVTLTVTGLKNPSEVRVFDNANPTVELDGEEDITSGTFTSLIDVATYPNVIIAVLSLGYQNIRLTDIDLTGGDVEIPVQQQVDRQYLNP